MRTTADRPEGEAGAERQPSRRVAGGPDAGAEVARRARPVPNARVLLGLQRRAGNAAVAKLVARSRGPGEGGPQPGGTASDAVAPERVVPGGDEVVAQRRVDGGGAAAPPRPEPVDPHADPRFARVVGQVGGAAKVVRGEEPETSRRRTGPHRRPASPRHRTRSTPPCRTT